MTRVLITGASGFLGGHLIDHVLANTDWDITTVTREENKVLDLIPRVTNCVVDLTERSPELAESPDYIIANASEVSVPGSIADPVSFITHNTAIILHTLELARECKPKAVLLVSSNEVYGAGKRHEWDMIIPGNPYAASKAAQEAIAIAYWKTYDVPVIIVNTMNPFGERQGPERFIPKVIKAVSLGEEITIHPGGRSWIHARNLADGILFLLDAAVKDRFAAWPARFNIAGYYPVSNVDLAEKIAEYMGKPLKYRLEESDRPGHEFYYDLDISKIASLGWKPPVSFTESLQRTVAKENG